MGLFGKKNKQRKDDNEEHVTNSRTFQQDRRYKFRYGAKTSDGLKNVQEITVAKIMVQNLAEYCLGKKPTFII